MCLVFSILYALTLNEVGIFYGGEFFSQSNVDGNRYSAKIDDKEAYFTLEDKTVWFTVAEKTYGPYTTDKDITLYKEDIVLKEGTNVVFEGDIIDSDEGIILVSKDGDVDLGVTIETDDGSYDLSGEKITDGPPSDQVVLSLMAGKFTHKGQITWLILGFVASILEIFSILFQDDLFRWRIGLRVGNIVSAEASSLELSLRNVAYTAVTIAILITFIYGLK